MARRSRDEASILGRGKLGCQLGESLDGILDNGFVTGGLTYMAANEGWENNTERATKQTSRVG